MKHPIRNTVAGLSLSAAAFAAILVTEDYRGAAYTPVPGDVPTIGFGTTHGVHMGDTITPTQAVVRALHDARQFEGALKRCVTAPLHQHEYDALVHFAYNIGETRFCGSTLVRRINAGDYDGACREILRWSYLQGRNCALPENRNRRDGCRGIMDRREKEYRWCTGEAIP